MTAAWEAPYQISGQAPLRDGATPALLGFKAYNLARMAAIGLNVPAAFVLGTGYCATPQELLDRLTALRAKGAPADRTAVAATPDALTDHGG